MYDFIHMSKTIQVKVFLTLLGKGDIQIFCNTIKVHFGPVTKILAYFSMARGLTNFIPESNRTEKLNIMILDLK